MPWRTTLTPPAFVEITPPIWQLPCEPIVSGKKPPALSTSALNRESTQPASTTATPSRRSTLRTAFIRSRLRTTSSPSCEGVAPATRPVLPPCGTTRTPASPHQRRIAATSSTSRGRTTAADRPWWSPVMSLSYRAAAFGSASCASPTSLANPERMDAGSSVVGRPYDHSRIGPSRDRYTRPGSPCTRRIHACRPPRRCPISCGRRGNPDRLLRSRG